MQRPGLSRASQRFVGGPIGWERWGAEKLQDTRRKLRDQPEKAEASEAAEERFRNAPEKVHSTLRIGSLGVESSVRHRPY